MKAQTPTKFFHGRAKPVELPHYENVAGSSIGKCVDGRLTERFIAIADRAGRSLFPKTMVFLES
jgi:hypothetical protein